MDLYVGIFDRLSDWTILLRFCCSNELLLPNRWETSVDSGEIPKAIFSVIPPPPIAYSPLLFRHGNSTSPHENHLNEK